MHWTNLPWDEIKHIKMSAQESCNSKCSRLYNLDPKFFYKTRGVADEKVQEVRDTNSSCPGLEHLATLTFNLGDWEPLLTLRNLQKKNKKKTIKHDIFTGSDIQQKWNLQQENNMQLTFSRANEKWNYLLVSHGTVEKSKSFVYSL